MGIGYSAALELAEKEAEELQQLISRKNPFKCNFVDSILMTINREMQHICDWD